MYFLGHKMPMVGLGTWKSAEGEVFDAVVTALKAGYKVGDILIL